MRHTGSVVDVTARTIRDRDGETHALDRLEIAGGVLYHARPLDYHAFDYHERWVFPHLGWTISRLRWLVEPELDWYIEPDLISVAGNHWAIADGLLDVLLYERSHYLVDDADELADAVAGGHISLDDAATVLRNFQSLERQLRANAFSGHELLRLHAPALAHFETPARALPA
jgi:hypothetical protein